MGRSGSTALANWLTRAPHEIVFVEPFFLHPRTSRLLRIQLQGLGLGVRDEEWNGRSGTPLERFEKLVVPLLRGRRWAVKEVLSDEHFAYQETFHPPRVIITVRNIVDVALSFFEKHRMQGNLERFSDEWVLDYCRRESDGILRFKGHLDNLQVPSLVVQYEELIRSSDCRRRAADFVGWEGGGAVQANLEEFDRAFELRRHGIKFSGNARRKEHRELGFKELANAESLLNDCYPYQKAFNYC